MPLFAENSQDRVMIFVDLRNVLKSVEAISTVGLHIDFYALAKQLTGPRRLVGLYAFDTRMPFGVTDPAHGLHDKLRYSGYRIIARESFDEVTHRQKEVDVALACELLTHGFRNNYDVGILVSGDRDFVPAIQHVQAFGKRVEVAAFQNSVSSEMIRRADRFHELERYPLLIMESVSMEVDEDD